MRFDSKRPLGSFQPSIVACEGLPAKDGNIDVGRIDVDGQAGTSRHFRSNQRRTGAAEWIDALIRGLPIPLRNRMSKPK